MVVLLLVSCGGNGNGYPGSESMIAVPIEFVCTGSRVSRVLVVRDSDVTATVYVEHLESGLPVQDVFTVARAQNSTQASYLSSQWDSSSGLSLVIGLSSGAHTDLPGSLTATTTNGMALSDTQLLCIGY